MFRFPGIYSTPKIKKVRARVKAYNIINSSESESEHHTFSTCMSHLQYAPTLLIFGVE